MRSNRIASSLGASFKNPSEILVTFKERYYIILKYIVLYVIMENKFLNKGKMHFLPAAPIHRFRLLPPQPLPAVPTSNHRKVTTTTPRIETMDNPQTGPDPAVQSAIERGNKVVFFDVALGGSDDATTTGEKEEKSVKMLGRIKLELFVKDVSFCVITCVCFRQCWCGDLSHHFPLISFIFDSLFVDTNY